MRSNSSSSRFRSSTAKRFHNALKKEEEPDENHDALRPNVTVKEEPMEEASLEARFEEQHDIFAAAGRPVLQPATTTVIRRSPTTTNGFPHTTNYGFPTTTAGLRRNPYEGVNTGGFGQPFPGASQSNGNVGYGPARVTRNVAPLPQQQQPNGQVAVVVCNERRFRRGLAQKKSFLYQFKTCIRWSSRGGFRRCR